MKKHLLLLLGILLSLPAAARDFDYTYEGKTITYTVLDEEAKTVETKSGDYLYGYVPGNNISGDLVIPAQVSDGNNVYKVTEISEFAFTGCDGLTSVEIPNSVSSIGHLAFYGCSGLPSMTIPNSVIYIGSNAFKFCSGLTSVEIPNSVTYIGNDAFNGCSSLTSVSVPNSVTNIGGNAFSRCSSLERIYVEEGNKNYCSVDGVLFNFDKTTLIQYPSGKNGQYNIPNSVISIDNDAFSDCSGLTSVGIPSSVTAIYDSVFSGCSGLTSVEIPNSVTSIGRWAFSGCSGLTSMVIPNSVTSIDGWAFYGCSGLTSVEIPNSVTSIGEGAFYHCSGLTSVEIPNSVTSIGYRTFSGCSGLTSVTIPNSVTNIGEGAFSGCSGLTSVEIPNSVISIGQSAFEGCSGLTGELIIPNSVTEIGKYAFFGCSGLTSVEIPNSVTTIGEGAFFWCSGLTSVTIPNSVTSIGNSAFWGCSGLTSVTIPNSVTSIGEGTFGSCSGLTSVTIPNSVTSIGNSAFWVCRGLTSVTIPNSVTSIGETVFGHCYSLKLVEIKGDRVLTFNNCFQYSHIENILVPQSVIEGYRSQYPDYNFISDNDVNFAYSGEGDGFEIEESESAMLTLSLDNADLATGFQTDITLPAGLTIAGKDGELDVYFGENTATESHVISASKVDGENKYRIVAYSSKNETFESGEGLLNINLVSDDQLKGGDITLDNTEISLIGDISCHPDAMTISVTVTEPLYGDSNDNGIVAIDDVVTDVQYILEKNPTPFSFKKADVNRDNRISIIDVSKTVAIILSNSPANAPRRAPAIGLSNSLPGLSADIVNNSASRKTMTVSLGDVDNITALQGDIELPEGVRVTGISISTEQKSNHKVDFAYIADNRVRFVVYSLSLANMNGDAPIVEVALDCDSSATDRTVELYDLMVSDTDSNLMNFGALSVGVSNGTTTGIESVTADDEPVRYFLINGTEVKDASTPGFYIVRKGDKVKKLKIDNSLQSKAPVGR